MDLELRRRQAVLDSISGTGTAPGDASYITIAAEADLTSERRLAVGSTRISLTDAGANSTVTLDALMSSTDWDWTRGITVTAPSTDVGLTLIDASGHTGDALNILDSAASINFRINAGGNQVFAGLTTSSTSRFNIRDTAFFNLRTNDSVGTEIACALFGTVATGTTGFALNKSLVLQHQDEAIVLAGVSGSTGELLSLKIGGATFDAGTAKISSNNLILSGHYPGTGAGANNRYNQKQGATLALDFASVNITGSLTVSGSLPVHELLSATHSDSVAQTVSRGSLIYGNSTPSWDELVKGSAHQFLQSGALDVSWVTMSGDATLAAGVLTIANNAVDAAKLRDSSALSVMGRGVNSSGDPGDILATANGQYLQRNSNLVGFGSIQVADLPAHTHASSTQGGSTLTPAIFDSTGTNAISGDITPPAITSNQNDYNPTGLSTATVLRLSLTGASRLIGGIAGGSDGRIIILHNTNASGRLRLVDDDASSSTAANRFALPNNKDVIMDPDESVVLWYDATSSRWRMMAGIPGEHRAVGTWIFQEGLGTFDPATGFVFYVRANEGAMTADTNAYLPGGDGTDIFLIDEDTVQFVSNKTFSSCSYIGGNFFTDTASVGVGFLDSTGPQDKYLRLILSGLAHSTNNSLTFKGDSVRDWEFAGPSGRVATDANISCLNNEVVVIDDSVVLLS